MLFIFANITTSRDYLIMRKELSILTYLLFSTFSVIVVVDHWCYLIFKTLMHCISMRITIKTFVVLVFGGARS